MIDSGAEYLDVTPARFHRKSAVHEAVIIEYSLENAEAEPTATERTTAFNICGHKEKASVSPRGSDFNLIRAGLARTGASTEGRYTWRNKRSHRAHTQPSSSSQNLVLWHEHPNTQNMRAKHSKKPHG
jgi:hypothetical protein